MSSSLPLVKKNVVYLVETFHSMTSQSLSSLTSFFHRELSVPFELTGSWIEWILLE